MSPYSTRLCSSVHEPEEMCSMSKASRESAPDVTDYGPAEDRGAHIDGYAVIFTSIREDWDLTPLLKGLPGDSCQCPHWGYVTAGQRHVRFVGRPKVIEPGGAVFMPPGPRLA